jgi:hypothetical protein
MNYDQILTTIGISQSTLEHILIFGLIAVVIGYFVVVAWQVILAGIFVIGILIVFGHHEDTQAKTEPTKIEKTQKEQFMEDCVSLTEKESMCETLWLERMEN